MADYDRFQLPVPWVGQIDAATILFVSSNPSIGKDDHATGAALDETVWESHQFAFGGGSHRYIIDGVKSTDVHGNPIKTVAYWRDMLRRVGEIMPGHAVEAGKDYAFTEIVHCKSEGQFGVARALRTCGELHMESVFTAAGARLVVAVGAFARLWFFKGPAPPSPVEMELGGRSRLVAFLPHPNSRGGDKSFRGRYSPTDMERMRAAVRAH